MISIDELDRAILEHEARDTSYANCERLAWLYIVRDHITGQETKQPSPLDISGDSEFLQAVNGRDSVRVWAIMNELMDVIYATNMRLYDVMQSSEKFGKSKAVGRNNTSLLLLARQ